MPSGQVTTMACALGQTMQELKEHLASELRMPADKLVFMFDGKIICWCTSLQPFACVFNVWDLFRKRDEFDS